ncbi:MAG TPA: HAD-IA family hydrolase [Treponemataceae bacterium]|jgi:putative hydrolase of the HAD superfamily|nr:HAD-IA family hydrolase [Treponemataceae bacterium]
MVQHLLLDLDNTLYPASGGMDEGITRRMLGFVAEWLGVSFEEAQLRRKQALPAYGTTLEWLRAEHNMHDEQRYFEAVHPESEIEELQADPELRTYLLSLGYPMTLLTNAPMAHADRVLKFFNIEDVFLGIFDLSYHKGLGKPHPDCFLNTLSAVGHTVADTVFVDDHPKYVRGFKALGGRAILVDETGKNLELAKTEGFGHIRSIYMLKEYLDSSCEGRSLKY